MVVIKGSILPLKDSAEVIGSSIRLLEDNDRVWRSSSEKIFVFVQLKCSKGLIHYVNRVIRHDSRMWLYSFVPVCCEMFWRTRSPLRLHTPADGDCTDF